MEALHIWVRHRLPEPEGCERCGRKAKLDLANISQEYKQDLDDWEYLCRRCHITGDGRIARLIKMGKEAQMAKRKGIAA
jgi:hypothetical protein